MDSAKFDAIMSTIMNNEDPPLNDSRKLIDEIILYAKLVAAGTESEKIYFYEKCLESLDKLVKIISQI